MVICFLFCFLKSLSNQASLKLEKVNNWRDMVVVGIEQEGIFFFGFYQMLCDVDGFRCSFGQ